MYILLFYDLIVKMLRLYYYFLNCPGNQYCKNRVNNDNEIKSNKQKITIFEIFILQTDFHVILIELIIDSFLIVPNCYRNHHVKFE